MQYLEEIFDATKELVLQIAQELSGTVEMKPFREEAGVLFCEIVSPSASAEAFGMLQRLRGRLDEKEAEGTFPVKIVTENRIDRHEDGAALEISLTDRV